MYQLNNLTKLQKNRKRIGRGGSRGGTSGKGHKGQRARSGGPKAPGFEGGQMPLSRRLPKRGFNNYNFRKEFEVVNLKVLESKFDEGVEISKQTLIENNLIKGTKGSFVKILGGHKLTKKLNVLADAFSKSAIEEINRVGGKAQLTREN